MHLNFVLLYCLLHFTQFLNSWRQLWFEPWMLTDLLKYSINYEVHESLNIIYRTWFITIFFISRIQKSPAKKLFKQHTRSLRPSLVPGTVLILLAGPHKGKRVVLLKQLESGLLLVTGPFVINACPLRRISQRYVIGTKTTIDISGVKLPENLNDAYFRRERKKRAKKEEGDIFSSKKEVSINSGKNNVKWYLACLISSLIFLLDLC